MKETMNDINKVISDIEGKKIHLGGMMETSTKDVMEKLLGRKINDQDEKVKEDRNVLQDCMNTLNQPYMWHIDFNRPVQSTNGVKGKVKSLIIRVIRKFVRPVMFPIVEEQKRYNAQVVRTMNEMYALNSKQSRTISYLTNELVELKYSNKESNIITADGYGQIDYAKFENHFRGDEETIMKKQEEYLAYVKNSKSLIDIGCGRGEFLKLVKEYGIDATGVEMYEDYVAKCIKDGLKVVWDDGINYLKKLNNESVDAITGFQVAEHLTTARLIELCQLSYEKITEGGVLILETPNPQCLSIYTNSFYLDSTHTKPVHPKALQYYLEEAGFSKVEILYTQSSKVPYSLPLIEEEISNKKQVNDGIWVLSELIWGSQDYAVIAYK